MRKRVVRVQRVAKKQGHAQLNILATDEDRELDFIVFVRILDQLPESFSLGLAVIWKEGRATLYRWNGDHGFHRNPDGTMLEGPHIHLVDAADRVAPPRPGRTRWVAVPRDLQKLSAKTQTRLLRSYIPAAPSFLHDRDTVRARLTDFAA